MGRIMNDEIFLIDYIHLQKTIDVSIDDIRNAFGVPLHRTFIEGQLYHLEWNIYTIHGLAIICNWKNSLAPRTQDFTTWVIEAHNEATADVVCSKIREANE